MIPTICHFRKCKTIETVKKKKSWLRTEGEEGIDE